MFCPDSICNVSRLSSFCNAFVFYDACVICDAFVPCSDFGFATSSRSLHNSLEEVRKRQQYHLQQAAAASRNIKITELKKQVAELQA